MGRIEARAFTLYMLVGLGICIFLFGSSSESNIAQEQFNTTVTSTVSKLEIIETKMLGPHVLEVILKNGYSKDITTVVASIGDYKVSRRDYIFAELEKWQNFSSGTTDDFIYTIDSIEQENIVIKAVLFNDMTTEGDPKEIMEVLGKRYGVKVQLGRFNSHLEKIKKLDYTKVTYEEVQTELQKLKQVAENLPIKLDDGRPISQAVDYGLKHGRTRILYVISLMNDLIEEEKKVDFPVFDRNRDGKYEKFHRTLIEREALFKSLEKRL